MEFLIAIIALALLVVVILVISAPLRAIGRPRDHVSAPQNPVLGEGRAELETAREAKYREIRDTELDYRTGKLSREDFAATDGALRAEAVEILDQLGALDEDEDGDRDDPDS